MLVVTNMEDKALIQHATYKLKWHIFKSFREYIEQLKITYSYNIYYLSFFFLTITILIGSWEKKWIKSM